jgi:hypothetical protein
MKVLILIILIGTVCFSCAESTGTTPDKIKDDLTEEFDQLAYLEKLNSENGVYYGTSTYNSLIVAGNQIIDSKIWSSFSKNHHLPLDQEWDSIACRVENDSLIVQYMFAVWGSCPNSVIAIVDDEDYFNLSIKTLEVLNGNPQLQNGDTIWMDGVCDAANISQYIFKYPINNRDLRKSVTFQDSLIYTIKYHDLSMNQIEYKYKYFPKCNFTTVKVFPLDGNPNNGGAKSVLKSKSDGTELTKSQVDDFLKIINDTNSYDNSSSACFEPSIGLVFYDSTNRACSYLSLCLDCNNIYCSPSLPGRLDHQDGFSLKTRKKLRRIFTDWGYAPHVFSSFYDDEEDLIQFLKEEGESQENIQSRVEVFKQELLGREESNRLYNEENKNLGK